MYRTLIITMYYGLLRISEVTAGAHPILARDVFIGDNKKKFKLILRTSKTHWKNSKPQIIKIAALLPIKELSEKTQETIAQTASERLPCPYQLLREYSVKRGDFCQDADPFFVFSDRSPVRPIDVNACLKQAIQNANFDSSLYGSHSLRIGRSSDLYKLGLSIETIKKIGRWKSNAVFRYLRS